MKRFLRKQNKFLLAIILLAVIAVAGSFSYAIFTSVTTGENVLTILTGNLYPLIESDAFNEQKQVIVPANSDKNFVIKLSNINNKSAKMNLYYSSENDSSNVSVVYLPDGDKAPGKEGIVLNKYGETNSSKTISVIIGNYSSSSITITFGSDAGLSNRTLDFPSGKNVILPSASTTIRKNNPLQTAKTNMFDYSSEGKKYNGVTKETTTDPNYVTNGLYSAEDEDGDSYYFRGNVNNIVKFGKYEKDYYVYQGTVKGAIYNFTSLVACRYADSTCTETNKVKFASAGDDMYWKIIRINGDGTVRMIYAGTTPEAIGMNAGIGVSRYNATYNDLKYSGYTYDNGVDSSIKTEVDTWYNNNLKGTSYDKQIAVGKFCSDSSGTVEDATELIANQNWPADSKMFQTARRVWNDYVGTGNHNAPNLVCPETDKTFGGKYNLKAGLITADEMNLAGLIFTGNGSNYLRNGHWFWSMTPSAFASGSTRVFYVYGGGYLGAHYVYGHEGLVRPVINLSADTKFAEGGEGTTSNPYVVE